MTRLKNPNILLSLLFSLVSLISGFCGLSEVIMKYPVSFLGSILFILNFLVFAAAIFVFSGILWGKKSLIIAGIGVLISESLLYAFLYMYKTVRFFPTAAETVNFLFLLMPVISYIFLLLYITDTLKVKKFVASLLTVSFIILIFSSYFFGGFSVIFLISSFGLLLYYVNIKTLDVKVNTGEVFFLSILTFGIFYILWAFYTIRKIKVITKDDTSLFPESLFFITIPFYASFWFYSRYEDLNENLPRVKNRGVLCMVLALILLSPLSLSILQRDLNKVSGEFIKESDSCTDKETLTEDNTL